MARYGSVRRGPGVRRFASPSLVGGGTGPDMARILPGSRSENTGPSHNVALCRAACQGDPGGAGHFSRVSGCTRPCGGLIGAGSGSVRAPGVPVPVTVCVLVQVAHYGAVAVPRALSHCKVWGIAIGLPRGAAVVTSRTSGIRRSGAGCQVTGWTGAITRAGGRPSRGDIVPAVRSCHRIHLSRQG